MDPTIQRAFDAARVAEANARFDDARQIYEYVVQTFPNSQDALHARQSLARLSAQMSQPNTNAQTLRPPQANGHANGHAAPPVTSAQPTQASAPQNRAEELGDAIAHAQYRGRVFPAKKKYRSGYAVSRAVLVLGIIAMLLSGLLGYSLSELTRTDAGFMIGLIGVAGLFFGGAFLILVGLIARATFDTANVNRRVAELLDVHTSDG